MKKIAFFIFTTILLGCKNEKHAHSILVKNNSDTIILNTVEDTIIRNISRTCDESQEININEYYLCKNWNLLDENQIKEILKNSEKGVNDEANARALHYTTSEFSIWTLADVSVGQQKLKLKLNAGSYFYLTNSKNETSLYFCKNNKLREYFISGIGVEDDDRYLLKESQAEKEIQSLKINLSSWQGVYNFDNGSFEQGYRNYHLEIKNDICILYQGELPAYKIECLPVEKNEELFFYLKSNDTKNAVYDTSLIESLHKGDFLFKLFKIKNKFFINSNLIKYWNEDKNKYEENVNIEVTKSVQ